MTAHASDDDVDDLLGHTVGQHRQLGSGAENEERVDAADHPVQLALQRGDVE